ncbi:aspartic proteinase Asp1 isoform X2 [Daucus carota subsp. sativus]|uniref:aspartic proteinase Asp1 isoform X2 n=1 Tax=Daucus carota subsp. sativus TaxID=79200 RepID=UPI0007B1E451|nr:PREDICTED: aspartic proteinase Asp1-like isoform X2 [Daucus carota subsp. sativus]
MIEQRVMVLLYLVALSETFQQCFSFSNDQLVKPENVAYHKGSSIILPVSGNVYPKGYYHATVNIGNPPRSYFLDIDTGSDVTWLQCDAPCIKYFPAPHPLYKPSKDIVKCNDPFCALFHWPNSVPSKSPEEQCDYEVVYADHGSSLGVLIRDVFPLKMTNDNTAFPRLAFGCGYNQEVANGVPPPCTDGVLGLGNGKSTILAQLRKLGLMQNVFGHCFSAQGGGYLFIGDNILPSSEIVWAPMSRKFSKDHYSLGPSELRFDGQATGVKGIPVIFDSGSTYTYFGYRAYRALLYMLKKNLNQYQFEDANDDKTLPVCWKSTKAFNSIHDVKNLFKPLILSFPNSKNVQLQLSPEAYLIVSDRGNVCLGILNGADVGLEGTIIIGDISMQDKSVIYDNEKQQIGWVSANCDRLQMPS